jgi:hypothetical protein
MPSRVSLSVFFHFGDHAGCLGGAAGFGGNADVHDAGMSGQAHGRVGKQLQITDLVVEYSFADPADMQGTNRDDVV